MGPDLVIAMVVAAGVTHAWEKGKRRSLAAWADSRRRAEDRGAERERARQQRMRARRSRFATAWSTGPRDPLWWVYAAGWLVAASMSATVAGVQGARSGAAAGARGGYRVGREAARRGASYRDAWRQWRGERDWIETEQCQRCGGYVTITQVTVVPEYGRVCPDCVPQPTTGRDEPDSEPEAESEADPREVAGPCRSCGRQCPRLERDADGWCRECVDALNSSRNGGEVWGCARCGNVVSAFHLGARSTPDRVLCIGCSAAERDQEQRNSGQGGSQRVETCSSCGVLLNDLDRNEGFHPGQRLCVVCSMARRDREQANATTNSGQDEKPGRIYVQAERADQQPADQEGNPAMPELMPANGAQIAGTGEGYTDTIQSLSSVAKLLNQALEEVNNLGDMLTANSLDADTLSQISDLTDALDSAAPTADNLVKHIESRHAPVADAVAGAGGSGNVASTVWYDQY